MVARSPSSSVFSSLISSSANRFRLIERISFWYSSNNRWRNFCVFLSSILSSLVPPKPSWFRNRDMGVYASGSSCQPTTFDEPDPEQVQHEQRQHLNSGARPKKHHHREQVLYQS